MSEPSPAPPPPLCVYCNAPWTDDMVKVMMQADFCDGYYEGDNTDSTFDTTVDVTCSSCKRLVYRKEVRFNWIGDPIPKSE